MLAALLAGFVPSDASGVGHVRTHPPASFPCLGVSLRPELAGCPGLLVSARRARHHQRQRRCGAPTSAAPRRIHSASYRRSARVRRTRSRPRVRMLGEFSRKTHAGRRKPAMRATSKNRLLRSPSRPAPLPAQLISWQGKPACRQSTRPSHGRGSKARMSPSCTCNQGKRSRRTEQG